MENENTLTENIDNQETQDINEPVINPEAVLKKNRELLKQNAELRKVAEQAKNFDFESAQRAIEYMAKAEEEKLSRKGDYEKLLEQKTKAYEERIEAERRERQQIERNLKTEKLANVLMEHGVLPDRVSYLVKELADNVELAYGENGFVLRKQGGIGDATEFEAMVEELKARSPFFFAPNITSGTGGVGSVTTTVTSPKRWAELSRAEKTAAIREADGDVSVAQKKYR